MSQGNNKVLCESTSVLEYKSTVFLLYESTDFYMNLTSEHFDSCNLTIYQPAKGFRYGPEGLALAEFAQVSAGARVAELCSGVGLISLLVAARVKEVSVTAVEIQEPLHKIALRNVEENKHQKGTSKSSLVSSLCHCEGVKRLKQSPADSCFRGIASLPSLARNDTLGVFRGAQNIVRCVNADYRKFAAANPDNFDVVLANPPFFAPAGRISPDLQRAAARHELNGTLQELVSAAHLLLCKDGIFALVFNLNRREELLALAQKTGFVVNHIEQPPNTSFFLAEFRKNVAIEVG